MIKQKNKILFISILLGYLPSLLLGQIHIQGKLSAANKQSPIHLSIYAKDAHEVQHYRAGDQFKCSVPRYEECLLVFYQEKSVSHIISINTFDQTKAPIRLNVHLEKANNDDKTGLHKGPAKRIRIVNNQAYFSRFDLDEVKDKGSYAAVMGDASDDLHQFYKTGQIPTEKISRSSNLTESALRKSEHRLGQEIYTLLKKKSAIEKKIALHKNKTIPQNNEGACAYELEQLKLETALAKFTYELSDKELQKENFAKAVSSFNCSSS